MKSLEAYEFLLERIKLSPQPFLVDINFDSRQQYNVEVVGGTLVHLKFYLEKKEIEDFLNYIDCDENLCIVVKNVEEFNGQITIINLYANKDVVDLLPISSRSNDYLFMFIDVGLNPTLHFAIHKEFLERLYKLFLDCGKNRFSKKENMKIFYKICKKFEIENSKTFKYLLDYIQVKNPNLRKEIRYENI